MPGNCRTTAWRSMRGLQAGKLHLSKQCLLSHDADVSETEDELIKHPPAWRDWCSKCGPRQGGSDEP